MSATRYLTLSIDDGYPGDLRTIEMLKKYGLKATFYVPGLNPERPKLPDAQVREIAQDPDFEVGGHTYSHTSLHVKSDAVAYEDIVRGKDWLENVIGKKTVSFCYPQGKFNSRTPGLVEKAGYLGARTCMLNLNSYPKTPFLWGASTLGYSLPPLIQIRHALIEGNFEGTWNYFKKFRLTQDWAQHFRIALDDVEQDGGIAHLFFHTWEIEALDQWNLLDGILKEISTRKSLKRVTNGELFAKFHSEYAKGSLST